MRTFFLLSILGGGLSAALAANPQINWWTLDSGGGTSTNARGLVLSGTIGQPDAGVMTGASLRVVGGFWGGIKPPPSPPPALSNLVVRGVTWPPQLHVETATNVDRVEYRINGRLALTAYGPPFDAIFDPVLFKTENPFAIGSNYLTATAVDTSARRSITEGSVVTWPEGPPVRAMVLEPCLDFEVFTDGATAPSAPFTLKALASVVDPNKHWSDPEIERPVDQVDFYVNGEWVGRSPGGTEWRNLIHQVEYDPKGLPRGRHSVRAKVVPPGGTWPTWASSRFWVTNRYPIVTISRTVTQQGNYFDVTLQAHNRGTGPAFLMRLTESVTGFQMCCVASSLDGVTLDMGFSYITKRNSVAVDFPARSELAPGSTYELTYKAVPVLFRTDAEYGFSGGGGLEFRAGTLCREIPPATTVVSADGESRSVANAVAAALRSSDYLLVTSPNNLETLYTASGAMQVMTNMAELATLRKGVLGYYHGVGRSRADAFVPEDLVAVGSLFPNRDRRDQVFVGHLEDNTVHCYAESGELFIDTPGQLPLKLSYNLQTGDALAVGNVCSGVECADDRPELVIAKGNGQGYLVCKFDPATDRFTTSELGPSIKFVRGDQFALGQVLLEDSGVPRDEIILANESGIHVWDYASGSSTPALSFPSAFRPGDLLAVGNLYNTWHDAMVVGSLAEDKLYVYVRKEDGTGYRVEQALDFPLDAGDAMAIGDVSGGGGVGGQEIIVADASAKLIRVLGYTGRWSGVRVVHEFPCEFESGDRLATGYFGSSSKESILVLRRTPVHTIQYYYWWHIVSIGSIEIIALTGGDAPGDRYDLDGLLNDGGAWANQLDPHWTTQGFLLLVGEDGIVPAFSVAWKLRHDDDFVDFTDREYASTVWPTDYPELSVGRVIGDTAERLSRTLRTATETAADPNLLRNGSAYIVDAYDEYPDRDYVATLAGWSFPHHYLDVRQQIAPSEDDFITSAQGKDVIFLTTFLGPYSGWDKDWDRIGQILGSAVEDRFEPGNTRPLVILYTTAGGQYARGRCLAEVFLGAGASSVIGMTVPRYWMGRRDYWIEYDSRLFNAEATEIYNFNRKAHTCPLGTALKLAKTEVYEWYGMEYSSADYDKERKAKRCLYNMAANHYFGDPKLQITYSDGARMQPSVAKASSQLPSSLVVTGPVAQVQVALPMYSVQTTNGVDLVEIPGSEEQLDAEGRPLVPLYRVVVEFPKGYKIQSVTMPQRSEPTVGPGLHLPIVEPIEAPPASGWWPDTDFHWWTLKNPDGSSTLRILVYPFQAYQEGTNVTQVRFHTNYTFGIDYIWSDVEIRRLTTDRSVYPTGAVMQAEVYLHNASTQTLDVVLSARVVSRLTEATNTLPARPMPSLQNWGWTQFEWDTTGQTGGPYRLEVVARDTQGTLLDETATEFQIGQALGTISDFNVTPRDYQLGDNVNLSATFANTGTKSLEGTIIIAVQDAAGNPVTEFRSDFTNVMPGATFRFDTVWTNASLTPRNCRVLVYGQYGGQTTALSVAADWSDAPLVWDAFLLADGQVQLRWASVAGRRYSIEFTPDLSTPFTSLVTGLLAAPPHNTVTLAVPPDSSGFFRLREE